MPSRFPSLRRLNSTEPYRHRSLPAAESASSGEDDRPDSEITFAVLHDDAPDYHFGPFSDDASLGTGHRRGSASSLAPSFRTRDSRAPSIHHYDSDYVANQRLLAEGYLNSEDMSPASHSREASMSQETLAMNPLNHLGKNDSRFAVDRKAIPPRSPSRQSWCTCDDGDDHHHAFKQDKLRLAEMDLEAQQQQLQQPQKPVKKEGGMGPGPGPGGPGGPGGSKGPKDPNVVCLGRCPFVLLHLLMFDRSRLTALTTPTIPKTGRAESVGLQLTLCRPSSLSLPSPRPWSPPASYLSPKISA